VRANEPHHVTHRGNRGEPVFLTRRDREMYLGLMERFAADSGVEVWAYCLMTNHVHLMVVPLRRGALANFIRKLHGNYARWMNWKRRWSGHLWANRYYSTALLEEHLWVAVRYIEQNPVRAGIVERAEDFRWSSAPAHCLRCPCALLAPTRPFPGSVPDWSLWLATQPDAQEIARLRSATLAGRWAPPAEGDPKPVDS
jgi:putative transposase